MDEHGHQDGDDGHVRADQEVDEPPRHGGPLQVLGGGNEALGEY